jgi:hypothetical protein
MAGSLVTDVVGALCPRTEVVVAGSFSELEPYDVFSSFCIT